MGILEVCVIRACSKQHCSDPRLITTPDLIEEAAALWESLAQNHPFIDGNTRKGFRTSRVRICDKARQVCGKVPFSSIADRAQKRREHFPAAQPATAAVRPAR